MKKILSALLAVSMLLALAACGSSSSSSGGSSSGSQSSGSTSSSQPAGSGSTSQPGGSSDTSEPAGSSSSTASQDPITLNIGYMPNYASLWALESGINKGYFEEEGITINVTEFGDGAAEIAAMEGGSIDLAYIGKGAHRLCIQGNAIIFAPSSVHTTDKLVVTKESGVQSVNDLKGKKIGYSAGSSSESTLDAALAAGGLTRDDVELYNLEPGYIVPAMISGDIDIAITWNPYSSQCLQQKEGSFEIEFSDGSTNMSSWICLPKYAEENRDILVRFSRALYRAMDWGSKEENSEEVAGYAAKRTGTDLESNLLQWGDAHWFNIEDIKTGLADGTIEGYYEGVQNDMIAGETITQEEAKDVSEWVLLDVMQEAIDQVS